MSAINPTLSTSTTSSLNQLTSTQKLEALIESQIALTEYLQDKSIQLDESTKKAFIKMNEDLKEITAFFKNKLSNENEVLEPKLEKLLNNTYSIFCEKQPVNKLKAKLFEYQLDAKQMVQDNQFSIANNVLGLCGSLLSCILPLIAPIVSAVANPSSLFGGGGLTSIMESVGNFFTTATKSAMGFMDNAAKDKIGKAIEDVTETPETASMIQNFQNYKEQLKGIKTLEQPEPSADSVHTNSFTPSF